MSAELVLCEPDKLELSIAGYQDMLPACPFCGASNPQLHTKQNTRTKLFVSHIRCQGGVGLVFNCNASVFACEKTREAAQNKAIEQWKRRAS